MIGERFGSFRIESKIGAGGMGAVYLARHEVIGNRAAIKVLLPHVCQDPQVVARFFNEAKALTLIEHPGIVRIYDFGQREDGSAYIVMEYLDGETLLARIHRLNALPCASALGFTRQIASALDGAHACGIIHRDLKPDNIFLVPDPEVPGGERIKLLDFGIAKLSGPAVADGFKTNTATLVGTPRYMSPEQCRGGSQVDARSDLYSLGCILFAMLCGRPPFEEGGAGEILAAHILRPPPQPRELNPTIPEPVQRLILGLLHKDPQQRLVSARAVIHAIGSLFADDVTGAAIHASSDIAHARAAVGQRPTTLSVAASSRSSLLAVSTHPRRWALHGTAAAGLCALGLLSAYWLTATPAETPPPPTGANELAAPPNELTAPPNEPIAPPVEFAAQPVDAQPEAEPRERWIAIAPPPGEPPALGVSRATLEATPDAVGFRPERAIAAPREPYQIHAHEVTWGAFEPWFARQTAAPWHLSRPPWLPDDPAQRAQLPVTGVSWQLARGYCESIDARLPSEAEWEYAARGAERRPYSWGSQTPDPDRTRVYAGPDAALAPVMTASQDRTPGDDDAAIYDMMGNAREWVAELWRDDRPDQDESWVRTETISFRTVRGLLPNAAQPEQFPVEGAAYRDALCASQACTVGHEGAFWYVGFRCARDPDDEHDDVRSDES